MNSSPGCSSVKKIRNCAAWPDAAATAARPPSRLAMRSSSTATVGLVRRVDVAEIVQVEERGGVVDIVEHIGGRLIDRRRARAGHRVGRRPGMDRAGLEAVAEIMRR